MKNLFFVSFYLFYFGISILSAQVSKSEFTKANVVWYGLDFTQARLIGSAGFTDPEAIRNDYFEKWNSLILVEADKYDLKEAFKKDDLKYNVEMIKTLNLGVDYSKLVQDKSYTFSKDVVLETVKAYQTEQESGYGIVFVVETFDKTQEKAFIWVTIFDAKNKAVLITERLDGAPAGFGLRNYWAGSVYKIINRIKDVKYKSWFR